MIMQGKKRVICFMPFVRVFHSITYFEKKEEEINSILCFSKQCHFQATNEK